MATAAKPLRDTAKSSHNSRPRAPKLKKGGPTELVLITGMLGALFPALSATTTERELGTLETLLVTPAGRTELLIAEQTRHAQAMSLVTNIRENGRPIGSLPDGEMWFHHDGCFIAEPYRATFLYAVEIPSEGGHTKFVSMHAAYDKLPEDVRIFIAAKTKYDEAVTVAGLPIARLISDQPAFVSETAVRDRALAWFRGEVVPPVFKKSSAPATTPTTQSDAKQQIMRAGVIRL